MSFALATCNYQLWADCDDILADGSAKRIRDIVAAYDHDVFCFTYELPGQGHSNMRERLFRRGHGHWCQPLHENCNHAPESKVANDTSIVYIHNPLEGNEKDHGRNERILKFYTRHALPFLWELHREYYFRWKNTRGDDARKECLRYAGLALAWPEIAPEMRYITLCSCAEVSDDVMQGKEFAWEAIRMYPQRREGYYVLGLREVEDGKFTRCAAVIEASAAFPKPPASGYPICGDAYGWPALDLLMRSYRLAGADKKADAMDAKAFARTGCKISLLHATRGRPKACIEARKLWFMASINPECIEHIFAVDADDAETIEATNGYKRVIVDEPNGCVKAWNAAAAASRGEILVQLSDDWVPCLHWDHFICQEVAKHFEEKERGPLVLQVDDGNRKDNLLCMAILTRERYEQQGKELFSAEYFGVYSDNEYSLRAFKDGVVRDSRHIHFKHQHPIFQGKPREEWDETHKRQNEQRRYDEGKAIFERRNAHLLTQ
jgi:hypothetical protein